MQIFSKPLYYKLDINVVIKYSKYLCALILVI